MPTQVYGWIAVTLSLIYKFPQIWKLYWEQNVDGISVLSQSVQASAYMFYVIHGSIIEDPPVVALGIASGIQSSILIAQYFYIKYYLGKEGKVIPGGEGEGEGGGGGGGNGYRVGTEGDEKTVSADVDSDLKHDKLDP